MAEDSTQLIDLAVARGLLSPDRAREAAGLAPDELVRRGWIEARELETLRKLAGQPRVLFDRYELIEEIGRGGMGVVYKCRDRRLDRLVALKGLPAAFGADVDRFEREARTAARLRHPNIVPVHDYGRRGDEIYLTMDLVEGRTFDELMAAGAVDREQALDVVRQVAEALDYAHAEGVVHRDVKPENVLVDAAGRALLTDFGLAKRVEGDATLTTTGMIMGTPAYMSPEQASGRPADFRSDIYNLGATLYWALTGRHAHTGATPMETALLILAEDPPPPGPEVPRDLRTIVMMCLERDPSRRYASAGELARDLARYRAGEPIVARAPSVMYRFSRFVGRRRALFVVAAAGAAAVAVTAAVLVPLWRGEREAALANLRRTADTSLQAALELRRAGRNESMARLLPEVEAAAAEVGDVAEAHYRLGRLYRAMMKFEQAAHEQDAALALDSNYAPALYERAVLAFRDQQPSEAYLARLDESSLDRARVLSARGLRASTQGRFEEAVTLLREARTLDPLLEEAWEAEGRALTSLGRDAEAAGVFTKALAIDRGYYPHYGGRAGARMSLGDVDGAVADWKQGVEFGATYSGAYHNLALAHLVRGDEKAALEVMTKALELEPRRAATRAQRAAVLYRLGRYEEARNECTRAIADDPKLVTAWIVRADARQELGDLAGAVDDLTGALKIDPQSVQALTGRGIARQAAGDLRGADADHSAVLDIDPDNAWAYYNRGNVRLQARDLDGAIDDYTACLARMAGFVDALNARGNARSAKGDLKGAIADHTMALQHDPGNATAYYNRAIVRWNAGEIDAAIEDLTTCLKHHPDGPSTASTMSMRGLLRLERGDWAEAADDFTRALAREPRDPYMLMRRGIARLRLREPADAAADFRAALEAAPVDWAPRNETKRLLAEAEELIKRLEDF